MISTNTSMLIAPPAELPMWARRGINLADPRLGAQAQCCSDDFFAPMSRMLNPEPACFIPGQYDDHGKWMDGWESRRKRTAGHDWCIIRLGCPGQITGFDLDTSFFTGNYPPAAKVEGCLQGDNPETAQWLALTPLLTLQGNQHHLITAIQAPDLVFSHIRLNIYPDGGMARLRVYGLPKPVQYSTGADGLIDLVALQHGGQALAWNDAHFGAAMNLLLPERGLNMGEGWETRRRREPGHDWCILALGLPGSIERIEVDTAHFKGNYPDRCSLQAIYLPEANADALVAQSQFWPTLLAENPLGADQIQSFQANSLGPVTHVRFNLHPDGGVSRLRLWGQPTGGTL